MADEEKIYQSKDAIGPSINTMLIVGGAGAIMSAAQNTLTKHNVGAWGFFTRTGGTVGMFGLILLYTVLKMQRSINTSVAAVGGTFEFARIASANLREKNDSWNSAIGGFLAGGIIGLRCWFHRYIVASPYIDGR